MNEKYSLAQLNAIYCVYKDLNPETRIINCVTCGKSIYIDSPEQCYSLYGHYIPRSVEPKLKYHPWNTNCQCPQCNTNETQQIKDSYRKYMTYRYGMDVDSKMKADAIKTDEEYVNFYIEQLIQLSSIFPELLNIVCDGETGEIKDIATAEVENKIERQFHTFSKTYRQDLDILSKQAGANNIEYERL